MPNPRTIFVIDDDGDFVSLLTEILTQASYQVQSSTDPVQALATAEGNHFDLIMIDQRMGQMTGCELLSRFRQKNTETPVIVISGFLEHTSAQQFINLGVAGLFFKPLNIFALLKRVEEIFKGLVKSSGTAALDSGVHGLTRTPFGNSSTKDVFLKKIQALSSFKGNLLLVGDAGIPFEMVAQEIVKKSTMGEKLVLWEPSFAKMEKCVAALKGVTSATFLVESVDMLSSSEKATMYKIAKHEPPFDDLPPSRFIFCLEQELDALYEKRAIDDEFYLFLGSLELKLPKVCPPGVPQNSDSGGRSRGSSKTPKRVLVLDDEDLHAQMIVDLLEEGGYQALKLNTPADALLAMKKERFCLIVTDFRMPGINGVDFVSQVRQLEPAMPIFVVTGNIQVPEMVRIGNMGITRLFEKPLELQKFLDEVRSVAKK